MKLTEVKNYILKFQTLLQSDLDFQTTETTCRSNIAPSPIFTRAVFLVYPTPEKNPQ